MQLTSILEEFPPCLCRLLARKPGKSRKPLTSREIANAAGLSRDVVDQISRETSWDSIRIADMISFTRACGLDILHMKRHREYIKRKNWAHLRHSPSQRYLESLMMTLYNHKLTHLHD